jgi:hypothetical protein
MVNHHGFDQRREEEKNVVKFNDDCYAEFEAKEISSNGALRYELDQWPRRCKAAS